MFRPRSLSLLALATLMSLAASAQTVDRAAAAKQIEANERAVNAAFAKGDAATLKKHLAAEGLSLEAAGAMTVPAMLEMLPQMKVESWAIDTCKVMWVNDTTAVATYRWTGKGSFAGQPISSPTWASTVWAHRGGNWVAVFHQETTAAPPAK